MRRASLLGVSVVVVWASACGGDPAESSSGSGGAAVSSTTASANDGAATATTGTGPLGSGGASVDASAGSVGGAGGSGGVGESSSSQGSVGGGDGNAGLPEPVILWTYEHDLDVAYGPAILPDGALAFQGQRPAGTPDTTPTLVVLEKTGALRWAVDTNPDTTAPAPTITADRVVAPAAGDDGKTRVFRYDFAGTPEAPLEIPSVSAPFQGLAVGADGTWYVPSDDVTAFKAGAPTWAAPFKLAGTNEVTGSNTAVAPDGTIYVAGRGPAERFVYAINPDGSEKWHQPTGDSHTAPIAVDFASRLYVMNGDSKLTVFEPNGDVAWTWQGPTDFSGGGVVIDAAGVVYFGLFALTGGLGAPLLFALKQNGTGADVLWNVQTGTYAITSTPALSKGGTLYVGNGCAELFAVQASDGKLLWRHEPDIGLCGTSGWSSPTIAPDGTVYASYGLDQSLTPRGTLYAFQGDGTGPDPAAPWPLEARDARRTARVP